MEALDIYELREWEAFWELEGGWGDWKADMRTGQVCSLYANAKRNPKTRPTPYSVEDFNLRPKAVERKKDNKKTIRAGLDALSAMTVKRKGKR